MSIPGDVGEQIAGGVVWTYEDANVKMTREITSSEGKPYLDTRIQATFKKSASINAGRGVALEVDLIAGATVVFSTKEVVETNLD